MSAESDRERILASLERLGHIEKGCPGCAEFYAAKWPLNVSAPRHKVRGSCKSGWRPHCTCDVCF